MKIPPKIPHLRPATILWAIYSLIWISLEGHLTRVIIMAVSTTLIAAGHFAQRYATNKQLSLPQWLIATTTTGTLLGFGIAILTLVFMGIKTGLHAHGPEFTATELNWLLQQIPFWSLLGSLTGLGLGLIATYLHDNPPPNNH